MVEGVEAVAAHELGQQLREGAGRVEELGADEAAAHDERGAQIAPWSERWPRPCRMDSVTCAILAARARGR